MAKSDCGASVSQNDVSLVVLNVLTWEQPLISTFVLLALNCVFWLVASWNRRFLSFAAALFLGRFLYKAWVNDIWPEIRVPPPEDEDTEGWTPVNPLVLSAPELGQYIDDFWNKLLILYKDSMKLRQANHGLFCLLGCSVCLFLALLGHMIPGILLIYSIVLGLTLGPGIVMHLIPTTIYDQLAGVFVEDHASHAVGAQSKCDTDSELEEFLPETSAEVLRQLSLRQEPSETLAVNVSALTTHEEEEEDSHLTTIRELGMESFVCESEESSLYAGLGHFPSVEEENESDIQDDDLAGAEPEATVEDKDAIQFVTSHFKEDSSESESDGVFTEGLSFAPIAEGKEPDESEPPSPLSNDKQEAKPEASTSSDFDEELLDFEILEESDIS